MSLNFTPAAQRAFVAAARWRMTDARAADVDEIGLLFGLAAEQESRAGTLLMARGVSLAMLEVRWRRRPASDQPPAQPRIAESLMQLISQAAEHLWELPRPAPIATEHLLLALVLDPLQLGQWLRQQGWEAAALEREIYALHGVTPGPVSVEEDLAPRPKSSNFDPHAPPRPPAMSQQMATLRILDAAANRAAEGLRVIEDYARFALDDGHLTQHCKQLRHDLTQALAMFPTGERLAARETTGDVGTTITTSREYLRRDMHDVVAANFARVEQSLRSLEEFAKLRHPAAGQRFEQLRYRSYTLQGAVQTTAHSVERLAHARLYVLIDGRATLDEFRDLARSLVDAGVHVLQLRDKQLDDRTLLARARALREITANSQALFIMNDRADLAVLAQADGVHVGQEELSVSDVRKIVGPTMLIGVSTHNMEQARRAVLEGASYLGVGPTFPSTTKQFDHFAGLDFIRQVAAEISLPAFAIGGVDTGNLSQVIDAGMKRVAVSGAIVGASDPIAAVQRFAEQLRG